MGFAQNTYSKFTKGRYFQSSQTPKLLLCVFLMVTNNDELYYLLALFSLSLSLSRSSHLGPQTQPWPSLVSKVRMTEEACTNRPCLSLWAALVGLPDAMLHSNLVRFLHEYLGPQSLAALLLSPEQAQSKGSKFSILISWSV